MCLRSSLRYEVEAEGASKNEHGELARMFARAGEDNFGKRWTKFSLQGCNLLQTSI